MRRHGWGSTTRLVHLITPGRRRRVRGQDRRRRRVRAGRLARPRVGRPVRWGESRSENLVGDGARPRRRRRWSPSAAAATGPSRPTAWSSTRTPAPTPGSARCCPTLTMLMAPAVYDFPEGARPGSCAGHEHHVGRRLPRGRAAGGDGGDRAGGRRVRRRDRHGPGRGPAEEPAAAVRPSRTPRATGAVYDSGDYPAALDAVLEAAGYAELRAEQARRRERGDVRQLGIGLSCYVEITGAGAEAGGPRGRRRRGAPRRHGDDPHRHLAARPGPRDRVGDARQRASSASRSRRSPSLHGDTDRIPRGGGTEGSRSLQQGGAAVHQAAVELVELARQRAAARLEVDPADLVVDRGLGRAARCAACPAPASRSPSWRPRSRCSCTAPFGRPAPRSRSARTSPSSRSTSSRARRSWCGWSPSTTPARSSTRCSPTGSGTAGSRRGRRRRCSRRSSTTPTATRRPRRSPTTRSSRRPSCPASSWSRRPRRPGTTRWAPRASARPARSARRPAVQNAVVDAVAHLGVRHIDMPATPMRVWRAIGHAQPGGAN